MADDDVGAGLGHGGRVVLVEDIGRRQQVLGVRQRDHVDLQPVGHAGFLEIGAEGAVDQPDGREVLDAGEADRLELRRGMVEQAERIGAVDAGQHRRVRDHRQDLAGHLDDDLVGVAIGQQARTASRGRPSGSGRNCR